jgi:uncharacterized protein (TIGR02246 family)
VDVSANREDIVAAVQVFLDAFNQGDAAGVATQYTDDAQLMPPNSDIVFGKQAIQDFWQGVFNTGIKSAILETVEVGGSADIAYETGTYTMLVEGGQEIDRGKYIIVWKNEAGQWKLYRDIWNSSIPAPAQ